jgi:hypothetical protein
MHRYVSYLRQPRSQPLSIRQFNAQHAELLDENRDFEHACLQAWQAGAAQRKRHAALTNAFPKPPPLRDAAPTQQSVSSTVTVARWGATPYQKQISAGDLREMRAFAADAKAGVPPRLQSWIPACSARAVAAALRQMDCGTPCPMLRLPCN